MRAVPCVRLALDPRIQVIAIQAKGAEALVPEPRSLQRHPKHCVQQVILPAPDGARGQHRAVCSLDEHALPVGQEGNEGNPAYLSTVRIILDEGEHNRTA